MRIPMTANIRNGRTTAIAIVHAARRGEPGPTTLRRSNRPAIVGARCFWFRRHRLCSCRFTFQTISRNDVARLDVNFVNGSGNPVNRSEFPLLQRAFDVNVLALLICHRNVGDFTIKDQAVPVCMGLRFAITPSETIRLTKADIGHFRSRRKESKFGLGGQITGEFEMVLLHRL